VTRAPFHWRSVAQVVCAEELANWNAASRSRGTQNRDHNWRSRSRAANWAIWTVTPLNIPQSAVIPPSTNSRAPVT